MKKYFTLIVLLLFSYLHTSTIRVDDLSEESVKVLREYQNKNPGPFTIKIEPESSTFQNMVQWGKWIIGKNNTETKTTIGWRVVKSIMQWTLGGTAVSYSAIFYLIYRAYKLLKTVGSWVHSLENHKEEDLILYVRQMSKRNTQDNHLKKIKEEKEIIKNYLKLHKQLCRWRIRNLFPYNKVLHRAIVKSFARLAALEEQLCKNSK